MILRTPANSRRQRAAAIQPGFQQHFTFSDQKERLHADLYPAALLPAKLAAPARRESRAEIETRPRRLSHPAPAVGRRDSRRRRLPDQGMTTRARRKTAPNETPY
jgi:hypothetical protein